MSAPGATRHAPVGSEGIDVHLQRLRGRIGTLGPIHTRRIEAGALIRFAQVTGETDPLLVDEEAAAVGPWGAVIAAPTYISTFPFDALQGLMVNDLPFDMMLHTDDAVEMGVPIRAGDEITSSARFADAYLREGRNGPMLFQVAEMTLTNQRGETAGVLRVGIVNFNSPRSVSDAAA